jgi:dolichol-phosphate mannosyltransferase
VKLSIVIPAHNEVEVIDDTLAALVETLERADSDFEVIVVDDGSTDGTGDRVATWAETNERIRCVRSPYENGFGLAVRAGLDVFEGDAVVIFMADGSDHPDDVAHYGRLLEAGYDCVFGSRFMSGGRVEGYPRLKLIINRAVNWGIRFLFGHGLNDTTNAFKAYRREVVETVSPLVSKHFNLTVELPLKAIVRGHSYVIVPISWTNRAAGTSKLSLQEMGSRYLFIVLSIFFEHHLSRGDYRLQEGDGSRTRWRARSPTATARDREFVDRQR